MREHLTVADHVRRWTRRLRCVAVRSFVPTAVAAVVVLPTIPAPDEAVEDAPGASVTNVHAPPAAATAADGDADPSMGTGTAATHGLPAEITTIAVPAHWVGLDFSTTEIPASPPTGTGLTRGPPTVTAPHA